MMYRLFSDSVYQFGSHIVVFLPRFGMRAEKIGEEKDLEDSKQHK